MFRWAWVSLLALLSTQSAVLAQHDVIQLTPKGGWASAFEPVRKVKVVAALRSIEPGETGSRLRLWFLDFRDPSLPVVLRAYEGDAWIQDIDIVGHCAYFAAGEAGLVVMEITEFPFFKSIQRLTDAISLSWNDLPGLTLQSTASLTNPEWTDVPGSLGTNRMALPPDGNAGFFRLAQPLVP